MPPKRKAAAKAGATRSTRSKVTQHKKAQGPKAARKNTSAKEANTTATESGKVETIVTPDKSVPDAAPLIFEVISGDKSKVLIGPDAEVKCFEYLERNPDSIVIHHKSLAALAKSQEQARKGNSGIATDIHSVTIKKEPGIEKHEEGSQLDAKMPAALDEPALSDTGGDNEKGKLEVTKSTGPYYVAKTDTDTRTFTGNDAEANLFAYLRENPGCFVEHFKSHDEYFASTAGSPVGKESNTNNLVFGEASTNETSGGFETPERINRFKPSSFGGNKPNFQRVMESGTSLFTSNKIDIIVSSTPFVKDSSDGKQGVVFVHFASGKGDDPKPYWAVKPSIMGNIFSGLDNDGFYSHDISLPQGIFKDINVAEMRGTPHGPNEGQRSKKNSSYTVEIMYMVVKMATSSLIGPDEIVHRIGQRIKTIVSESWFAEMYIASAESNISNHFAEALQKPKEKFFDLLKSSNVTYRKEVSLDHYLLDDAISDYVRDYFGHTRGVALWPTAIKGMAYKGGLTPGARSSSN